MIIRQANENDVPTILHFVQQLAIYEKLLPEVKATEQALRETLFGSRAYAEVVIAEVEGLPAGFALFFHNYSTFLAKPGIYLEDLFVLEEYRGRGIGQSLLKHLAKLCVERDCGRLEWSVLDWNEPAIDFYKSQGAELMNEWLINRLTGDALKKLAESAD
jgi:GNAT superfamily N-acetyltransferase